MKPYQEIEEVKRGAGDEFMKLWPMFQKIADDFSEKTGGAIMGFSINLVDVTEFGSDEKKSIVTDSRMNFAD